jgi:archaellum component FlaC
MQINKKLYTTLLITLLTMSIMLVAIPMVSAEVTVVPTATPNTGAVGTKVTVNATAGADPFATVTIYLDSLSGKVLGTTSANVDGDYSIQVTIPPTTAGLHYLVANDGETESRGAEFTVLPQLTTDVSLALPGDTVAVTGHGFAASKSVTLMLNSTTLATPYGVVLTVSPTTNASGSFTSSFVVPAIVLANFDVYNLTATDASLNVGNTTLNIDYYITVVPSAGPRGVTTTISGRIAPNKAYIINFNSAMISSGTTTADGSYSMTYTIPSILSEATYQVQVLWDLTNTRNATFQVLPSPVISLSATTGIVGNKITVTGSGFSSAASISVMFGGNVANDTSMGFGPTTGSTPGPAGQIPANAYFVVPALAPGVYAVLVQDQYGAVSNTILFTIIPTPVITIETRATAYMQGDQISIYTWSNTMPAVDYVYSIKDPVGNVLTSGTLLSTSWTMISANNYMVQYYAGWTDPEFMTLPADAPVGVWNFTATSGMTKLTNLFSVSAPATLDDVVDGIDEVKDSLADMTDMIDDISGDVVTIKGDANTIKNLINNLDIDIPDMSEITGDLTTIQMTLEALAATVSSIDGDVATIDTTLGTMSGKITSIEGNTATIETDVGTITADISDVKANVDSTPAWIAVVLALVAAVAAIFAVITIRQKIAG